MKTYVGPRMLDIVNAVEERKVVRDMHLSYEPFALLCVFKLKLYHGYKGLLRYF